MIPTSMTAEIRAMASRQLIRTRVLTYTKLERTRQFTSVTGIFFSKDRREEVIEVEEESEIIFIPETNERVKLMTQGQWMKGCPEGGEQSFLFGLYSHLSEPQCPCPHECGASIAKKKSDFFALVVSSHSPLFLDL
jgi:hypothetical protein